MAKTSVAQFYVNFNYDVSGSVPDGIAVDSIIRRVFYTDAGLNLIAAFNNDGSGYDVILDERHNLDEPRAIVLHSETR